MSFWLRCRVDKGMFSDEFAVTYPPSKIPWQKSVFVPSSFVRATNEREGTVMVKIAAEGDACYALLPTQDYDVVRVEEGDLLEE